MSHQPARRPSLSTGTRISALIAVLFASLQATSAAPRTAAAGPVRGGTMHVAYSGSVVTLDPAQAYNDDWWLMNGTLYNGLYQLDRYGRPQLDLAAAPPAISADRKTWTFTLRKGVRFSNGMEVTAEDLRYSIRRTLDPHLKPGTSWGQGMDSIFAGSDAFVAGKASDVSGIRALDRYTLRLQLAQPISVLPYILSVTFNMVVPEAVLSKESADTFAGNPVGTGPFKLRSWSKGNQLVFVRNPYYYRTGKPHVDTLIVDYNVPPNLIALRVEKGEIDGSANGSEMAATDIHQAQSDPRYAHYLVQGPIIWMSWLNLNVNIPPLDNPKLRQAVAMAINRAKLTKLLGGLAEPTGNLYLPIYPQNEPALDRSPVYAHDPNQAAALVKVSGYHGQPLTLYYPSDFGYNQGLATGIQQDLQGIGLNVSLRGTTTASLNALGSKLKGTQMAIFNWSPDYPDGYDVYASVFTCADNAAGGISSYAHYCDTGADALANRALITPLGPARDALASRRSTACWPAPPTCRWSTTCRWRWSTRASMDSTTRRRTAGNSRTTG